MGCDIHMYVQYREKRENDKNNWWSEYGGQINPGRNYAMFGILAGVRDWPEENKFFEPKGVPDFDLTYSARHDLYVEIRDPEDREDYETCTLEQAERWGRKIFRDEEGNPTKTYHPDWHSHSWLTTDELAQAYRWYRSSTKYPPPLEYRVLLKMMKELENKGKNEVVVVFWFDN